MSICWPDRREYARLERLGKHRRYRYCDITSKRVRNWVQERSQDKDDDEDHCFFEQNFCNFKFGNNNDLSANEYARLQRAFFWFEIHRRFFSDPEQHGKATWSEEEKQNAKFKRNTIYWYMKNTERRELQSVTAYLTERMKYNYNIIYRTVIFNLLPEVLGKMTFHVNNDEGEVDVNYSDERDSNCVSVDGVADGDIQLGSSIKGNVNSSDESLS